MGTCGACGATGRDTDRFCTTCGAPGDVGGSGGRAETRRPAPVDAGQPTTERSRARRAAPEPRLVHCPACEAANADSRERCGRCGADLMTGLPAAPDDALAAATAPSAQPAPAGRETSGLLLVVTLLASIAVLAVLATLLLARGPDWFGLSPQPTPTPAHVRVPTSEVSASSSRPALDGTGFGPEHVIDGDETTAWVHDGPGDGTGEWLELRLDRRVPVTRLVVWNGYQDRYVAYGRLTQVRLLLDEQALTADLLDVQGPQAVDLPEPVAADRVRVEVTGTRPGTEHRAAAVSGIEVYAER